jgi:membrane protein DedA with SNARE-associated domain
VLRRTIGRRTLTFALDLPIFAKKLQKFTNDPSVNNPTTQNEYINYSAKIILKCCRQYMFKLARRPTIRYNRCMSASVSQFANNLIDHLGLGGIAVGVFLNGLGIPGISEVLLPLSGVAVRDGHQSLYTLLPVAMIAQLAGVSLAYAIARYGGIGLIERYGKYILISHKELQSAHRQFNKHPWLIVVGGCVPGIQGFIGYIGGIADLNYGRFLASVAVGKVIWIGGLVALGYALGNQVDKLDGILSQLGLVVLVLVIIVIIWYLWSHRSHEDK